METGLAVAGLGGADMLAGLRQNLYRLIEADPQLCIYALLDPNCPVPDDDPLHVNALARREVPCTLRPVPRRDRADDASTLPQLLTLRTPASNGYPDEALFDLLLNCANHRAASINGSYVAGWLLARGNSEALAGHLERATVMLDPTQGRQRVLPFFEPHRLALIHGSDEKAPRGLLSPLLGPIAHWFYVDAIGELQCASAQPQGPAAAGRLTLADWQGQACVPMLRMVLVALARAEAVLPRRPETDIAKAIATAQRLGLNAMEDIVFFSLNCFTVGPQWHDHPVATRAIERAVTSDLPLTDSMQALSDGDLDAIAAHR